MARRFREVHETHVPERNLGGYWPYQVKQDMTPEQLRQRERDIEDAALGIDNITSSSWSWDNNTMDNGASTITKEEDVWDRAWQDSKVGAKLDTDDLDFENLNSDGKSKIENLGTKTKNATLSSSKDYSKEFGDKMTGALLKTYEVHNKLEIGPPKELLELAQQGIEMSKQGLSIPLEMVAKIDNFAFNDKQIEQINRGLAHGLSKKDVSVYADPKFSAEKMENWRVDLEFTKAWKNIDRGSKDIDKTRNLDMDMEK